MTNPFIPESFKPPTFFDSENFHFRVLEEEVAELACVVRQTSRCCNTIFVVDKNVLKQGEFSVCCNV